MKRIILTALFALGALTVQAQADGDSFQLVKKAGHYMFEAPVNGKEGTTILVESGIPALLADSAYVFESGILEGMELVDTGRKQHLNLGGDEFVITHKMHGTVKIGSNSSFRGDVFVLADYKERYAKFYEVALPVMYLHNDLDGGSRIIDLDLGNQRMSMLSRAALKDRKSAYSKSRMNTKTYLGMPAIKTTLVLDDGTKKRKLKGNYNIDFGNPEILFLLTQNKNVQRFLAKNADLDLHDATGPQGQVMAQLAFSEQCDLCGVRFPEAIVLFTKNLPRFTAEGDIGLKFFESVDALLDFDKSAVYISR